MTLPSRTLLPVCALLLAASPVTAQQLPAGFDRGWRETATLYRSMLEEEGIVGSSLWFFQDGRAIGKELFGFADLETGRRVDDATIYHWGSITKTLTGIAILQLRDRGLVALDDPVVDYVPELRRVHDPFGPIDAITIRHLLSHSAGFRAPTWPWGGGEDWHPHEPTEWSQLVATMPYTEILFEPGSRFSYSNPGIVFLGRVIEQLSGDDWEVYIDKNIFKPLGIHRSYFDTTPYHLLPDRSNNYTVVDGKPVANGLDFDTGITVSNGGLNAPITDMARYLSFLLGLGDATVNDGVLRRSSLEEMWRPVVPVRTDTVARVLESMALTFFVEESENLLLIGHTGSQKAFVSFFYIDPAARTAAIAAFNTVGRDGPPATGRILDRLRAQLFTSVFPLFH